MADNQDDKNAPENPASPDMAAKDAQDEKLRAANQARQAKDKPEGNAAEAKEPPNSGRDSRENAGRPPNGSNVRDVVGENVSVHQGAMYVNILNASYGAGGYASFGDMFSKLGGLNNPFFRGYENLFKATPADATLTNEDADTQKAGVKPPETEEEIEEWYCEKLTAWETCFVEAAAVLHGAPIHRVRDAADTLYHPTGQTENTPILQVTKISAKTLRTHLYMQTVYVEGAERLFWTDANASGLSTFATRLLPIIVRQSNLSATNKQGTHLLKQLERWATDLSGESAWRATRALGSLWLKLDMDHFQHMVNEWVESDDPDDWRRAATLLDGAYEAEYADQGERVNQGNNSFVLSFLARRTRHAHASFQVNAGSIVAQTYGRIGQRSITLALKGLEALLRYPLRRKKDSEIQIPLVVFVSTTWSYVTLARFGYIAEVLAHIASVVEKCCYQRRSPQGSERFEYRAQCRFMLETMFHIFFLIASASLSGVHDTMRGDYKREAKLPSNPILPSAEGQDMLLVGILSSEEGDWRQCIITIVCGAILEKNAEPAFLLLKIWAEIMLKEQSPVLRQAYADFMVEIWERGNQWCRHLAGVDEYDDPELFAFSYSEALHKWQIRKVGVPPQPIGAFAKDICRRLNI